MNTQINFFPEEKRVMVLDWLFKIGVSLYVIYICNGYPFAFSFFFISVPVVLAFSIC